MFLYTIIALTTLCSMVICPSSDHIVFRKAQQNFIEGKWQEALDLYDSLSYKDSVIWQNMGNCSFNMQQYPEALLYWKRSYKDVGCNIQRIRELLQSEHKVCKKLGLPDLPRWYDVVMIVVACVPLWVIYVVIIICLLFLLKYMLHYWRWNELQKSDRKKIMFMVLLILTMSALWYGHRMIFHNKAIVVKSDTFVYAGPEQTFHIVSQIRLGTVVSIQQQKNNMCNITTDTTAGWLDHGNIQKI